MKYPGKANFQKQKLSDCQGLRVGVGNCKQAQGNIFGVVSVLKLDCGTDCTTISLLKIYCILQWVNFIICEYTSINFFRNYKKQMRSLFPWSLYLMFRRQPLNNNYPNNCTVIMTVQLLCGKCYTKQLQDIIRPYDKKGPAEEVT